MPVSPVYVVPGPESVNDLVKRVADRDRAAFSRLYRRLVRVVFIQVSEIVGRPSVAVAVTRAVFVEVWQLAPRCAAGQVDGLAWVTAIADHRAAERNGLARPTAAPRPSAPDTTSLSVAN